MMPRLRGIERYFVVFKLKRSKSCAGYAVSTGLRIKLCLKEW